MKKFLFLAMLATAAGCADVQEPAEEAAQDTTEDLLARGTYLMESIVACGNCHTPKTSDGVPIENLHLAGGFAVGLAGEGAGQGGVEEVELGAADETFAVVGVPGAEEEGEVGGIQDAAP